MEIEDEPIRLPTGRTVLYLVLFVLAIVIVFRVIPYWIGLVVIPAVLLIADPKALKLSLIHISALVTARSAEADLKLSVILAHLNVKINTLSVNLQK